MEREQQPRPVPLLVSTKKRPPDHSNVSAFVLYQSTARNRSGQVSSRAHHFRRRPPPQAPPAAAPRRYAPNPAGTGEPTPLRPPTPQGRGQQNYAAAGESSAAQACPGRTAVSSPKARHARIAASHPTEHHRKRPCESIKIGMDDTSPGAAFPRHGLPRAVVGGTFTAPQSRSQRPLPKPTSTVCTAYKNPEKTR